MDEGTYQDLAFGKDTYSEVDIAVVQLDNHHIHNINNLNNHHYTVRMVVQGSVDIPLLFDRKKWVETLLVMVEEELIVEVEVFEVEVVVVVEVEVVRAELYQLAVLLFDNYSLVSMTCLDKKKLVQIVELVVGKVVKIEFVVVGIVVEKYQLVFLLFEQHQNLDKQNVIQSVEFA